MSRYMKIKFSIDSEILSGALAFLLLGAILALHVFALTVLWRWHVVPLGVKEISPWHALGLMCVLSASRFAAPREIDAWEWLKFNIGGPFLLLSIGYLAKEMM